MLPGAEMSKSYRPKLYRRRFEEGHDTAITHTDYVLYYHLVWSARKASYSIEASMIGNLADNLRKKSKQLGLHLLAVEINPQHVQCILSLRLTHYILEIVRQLKGFPSHEIDRGREQFLRCGRSYSVWTVGDKDLFAVTRYAEKQRRHHSANVRDES